MLKLNQGVLYIQYDNKMGHLRGFDSKQQMNNYKIRNIIRTKQQMNNYYNLYYNATSKILTENLTLTNP